MGLLLFNLSKSIFNYFYYLGFFFHLFVYYSIIIYQLYRHSTGKLQTFEFNVSFVLFCFNILIY